MEFVEKFERKKSLVTADWYEVRPTFASYIGMVKFTTLYGYNIASRQYVTPCLYPGLHINITKDICLLFCIVCLAINKRSDSLHYLFIYFVMKIAQLGYTNSNINQLRL